MVPYIPRMHHFIFRVMSCVFWRCAELEVALLTMARGTMPASSCCARRISVSASCVAVRLPGYSTCQAIQRLSVGSGKLSIFRSTWSTLWTPISDLWVCREKKCMWMVKQMAGWYFERETDAGCCECSSVFINSFKLLSGVMATNGKGWWMCLRFRSTIWYFTNKIFHNVKPSLTENPFSLFLLHLAVDDELCQ